MSDCPYGCERCEDWGTGACPYEDDDDPLEGQDDWEYDANDALSICEQCRYDSEQAGETPGCAGCALAESEQPSEPAPPDDDVPF